MSRAQYSKDSLLGALLRSAEESYLTHNEKDTLTVIVESAMDFIEGNQGRYNYIDEAVRACDEGDLSSWWANEGGSKIALETMGIVKRVGPQRREAEQPSMTSPAPI